MMPNRGYDMTPTMYSPDGRIYQVEYALETVKRGTLAIGIMTKEGIVLAVEEKTRALQVEGITQKIFQVDDHIGCLLYTSPSPRDLSTSRMPSSA